MFTSEHQHVSGLVAPTRALRGVASAATLKGTDSVSLKLKDPNDVAEEEEELEEARERVSLQGDQEDIVFVDWDGPDDPENPRK